MITITRKLWFSAGHRVWGHENVCSNLHGHNYEVHLTATARNLDPVGRVVDFSVLKDLFNNWLNANWDHGFLYYSLDRELSRAFQREELITMKTYRCPFNPTAEEMAKHLLDLGPEILSGTEVQLIRVKIFETPNCWAEATNEVIS